MKTMLAVAVSLFAFASASASVVYVDAEAPSGGDGAGWESAFTTLQEGIDKAYADGGGEVWVRGGLYDEERPASPGQTEVSGALMLRPGVVLFGGFAGGETEREMRDWAGNATIIDGVRARDGARACHVILGEDDATVDGFIIQGGFANEFTPCANTGAGVYTGGASPLFRHCTFRTNYASAGGGVSNSGGAPVFEDCVFEDNSAVRGGAVYNMSGGQIRFDRCIFQDNRASGYYGAGGVGGAILNEYGGRVECVNCVFYHNASQGATGRPSSGGAIANTASASLSLVNCTFHANAAANDDPLTSGRGGAVWSDNAGVVVTARNTIFWANTPQAIHGGVLDAAYCHSQDSTAVDPLFMDAAGADFRLAAGSPCIDTATADGAPGVDISGVARPQGAGYDMGAYESPTPPRALFTANVVIGSAPLAVQFVDKSTGTVETHLWDFGDGGTSALASPAHTYAYPGLYTVSLTAANASGQHTATRRNFILAWGKGITLADFFAWLVARLFP